MADAFSPGLPADAVRAKRLEMILALVEQLLQDAKGAPGPPGPPGSGAVPKNPTQESFFGGAPATQQTVTGLLASATTVSDLKTTIQSLMSALAAKYHLVVDSTT